jgi:hypothetical protein
MSQMGSHDPFGHLKLKLWSKEVKLAIWLPTTKSRESTRLHYVQVACDIPLESSWQGYNFASELILIEGLHAKLWGPKVAGKPTLVILRFPFRSPMTKCHLDVGLVERHIVYYKEEGGGFPQVQVVVSLVSLSLLVVHPSTKNVQTMH